MNTQLTFIELPSAPMQDIYRMVQQAGESDLSFFIMGETGVGKEGIARYIHKSSPRQDRPFVAINCGRFSAELLQSELFGHEEGAFTGASHQRQGALENANGGILFLDEVAEMSLEAQKMLLRVLDTRTFTRLGGNENLTTDIQVIAATNKNIGETILKAEFRSDLFYRLMGVMLDVPALRERPEDIAPLVETFIHEHNPKRGTGVTGITAAALTRLEHAAWPGNIRQLRMTVQIAIALATTNTLEVKDFPYNFFTLPDPERSNVQSDLRRDTLDTRTPIPTLISHLRALPVETQHRIVQGIAKDLQGFPEKETLCTENMNLREIIYQIARTRIEKYGTLGKAAASLDIDPRTLKIYAQPDKDEANNATIEFDFF